MNFDIIPNEELHPCVMLINQNDEVEALEDFNE
jgi:hypothetical protein